jgi:hypothetical protein
LKPVSDSDSEDGDDEEWGTDHTGDENDDEPEPVKKVGKQPMSDKDIEILENNIIDISEYFRNFIDFLKNSKSLTLKQYDKIVKSVYDLNKLMVDVKEATKSTREKII